MTDHHDPRPDPRPVFDGDWQSASGVEKGEHSERVRQWKERNGIATGQSAKRGGGGQSAKAQSQAQSHDEERERHLSTLQSVIDEPGALSSDRIRAVEARERILSRQAEEQALEVHGPLVALGEALRALPMEERVGALSTLLEVG